MSTIQEDSREAEYRHSLDEALKLCAAEPIHLIGKIQPVGVLLAVDGETLTVCMASDNLADLLPYAADVAIGMPLAALIGTDQIAILDNLASEEQSPGGLICSLILDRAGQPTSFDAHAFRSNGLIVIEIELEPPTAGDVFHRQFIPVRDSLWKLDAEQDIHSYSQAVVDEVRLLTGYDRVMMYRFDQNWDGETIAESKVDGAVSYLGNHFPASDIPAQARELYTRNLVRLIVDVEDVVVPIRQATAAAPTLDLSRSWLRSMSPVHVQYLRNMGVRASLSISLVQNNRLWGLIACHHLSPKYVPLRSREIDEFIARMVSLKLSNMENNERGMLQGKIRVLLQRLTESIRQTSDLSLALQAYQDDFLSLVQASGAVISIAGVRHQFGQTVSEITLQRLLGVLSEMPKSTVFCTDSLPEILPLGEDQAAIASGMMITPLDQELRDFVMWFRPGILRTLRWAGRPGKEFFRDAAGSLHISPRQSFETWMETYRDKSLAWSPVEIDAAGSLSLALVEVLAQKALKSSEASYRLLAENSTDLIARLDLDGNFLFVSPASASLFGADPTVMCGCNIEAWVLPEGRPALANLLAEMAQPGEEKTTLLHCRHEGGGTTWIEATLKCTRGIEGRNEIVINARNVTQRHTYQLAIEEVHRRNARIMDASGDGLMSLDANGYIVYVNELMVQALGIEANALIGRFCCTVLYHQEVKVPDCPFLKTLADGETRQGMIELPRADEKLKQMSFVCTPLVEGASINGAVLVFRDSMQPATDLILEQTDEAVMVTTADGVISSINRAFTEITGFLPDEAIGKPPRFLKSGVHTPNFYQDFWESLRTKHRWVGEIWNRRKNGEIYPQWGSVTAITDKAGNIQNYVAVFSDISKAKQAEEKLYYLANHDALTGLPNRMRFSEQIANTIDRVRRSHKRLAMVFIDVDRFKLINDSLGHHSGDIYLKTVSERLSKSCRSQDLLARWGGDEFVMLFEDVADVSVISAAIVRLQHLLAEPLLLDGHHLVPTVSIGISIYPEDASSASDLIKAADVAMYRAKELGRNRFAFFTEVMSRDVCEKLNVAAELPRAIQNQELCLYYQPQVGADDGRLIGVEALVRWQHPQRGMLQPGEFIPFAEELGLIEGVGKWVLNEACQQMRRWLDEGVAVPRVAVNVAPAQLSEGFVEYVEQSIARARLDASQIELEITEGALEAGEEVKQILKRLRAIGVLLSVDDFGTGYSSLSHIKLFPITCFKIDKSFIDGIPGCREDVAIIRAILALGSSLGMDIVAEGVESAIQFEFLKKSGVGSIQGFFFGKPMPAAALAEFASKPSPV